MCCETKVKIAATVRELLLTRPVSKITVQDVMQRADMTRQSFYYHFQDIYDVLEWDVRQKLHEQLTFRREQPFDAWCSEILDDMQSNQGLYRKISEALGRDKIQQLAAPYVSPQMARLLYGNDAFSRELTADEEIALDFAVRTMIDSFLSLTFSRARIDTDECVRRVQAIVNILQRGGEYRTNAAARYATVAC